MCVTDTHWPRKYPKTGWMLWKRRSNAYHPYVYLERENAEKQIGWFGDEVHKIRLVRIKTNPRGAEMSGHLEDIICPQCEQEQTAEVEHTRPFWTRVHTCQCGYIIMESEWETTEDRHRVIDNKE